MTLSVPMSDIYGKATGFTFNLTPVSADWTQITIDEDFAGRSVDEEITNADLLRLVSEEAFTHQDILGLILEADGDLVKGIVGVGSGNERFTLAKAALKAAIDELTAA
jgi:hypothetical protein